MEQITIIKPNGSEIDLMRLYPPINILQAKQRQVLMNEDVCIIEFESVEPLDLDIQDKVVVFDEEYKLNKLPNITKNGKGWFNYSCIFEGAMYDLRRARFRDKAVSGGSLNSEFSLTGDLFDIVSVVINNANRLFPAKWILIGYPDTEVKTMDFSLNNCLEALVLICEKFEYEYEITQGSGGLRYLNILKKGRVLPYQYEYGIGNGLYKIAREDVDNSNLITRVFATGSNKNLPSNYRNFSTKLKFSDESSLESQTAIDKYGVIEGDIEFDVFPSRRGTITSIFSNKKVFYDTSMFDLNESNSSGTKWLIAGTTAKISMITGKLAGYEFEIASYNHGEKKFTINEYKDDRGEIFPSPTLTAFQFEVGDVYTILDIRLPDSYVIEAEADVKQKAQEHLYKNSSPKVRYPIEVDELFLENGVPEIGSPISNIPDGWVHTDIGGDLVGFSQYVNGFKVIGGSNSDTNLSFLHRGILVDGNSLSSTLALEPKLFGSNTNVSVNAQFGLMVRFGLNADSKFVALKFQNGNYYTIFRDTVGGSIQVSGEPFAYSAMQRYGIYVEFNGLEQKVELLKFASNKFRTLINYINFTVTAPEKDDVRIGYFLGNTLGLRAVLKLDTIGNIETVPEIPVTDLGDYNYININNNNIGVGTFANNVYRITNAGLDVWGTQDKFGYLFFELDNSVGNLRANLVQLPNYLNTSTPLADFARVGLMWRAGNVTDSDCIGIAQNKNGAIFVFERYDNENINIIGSQTIKPNIHDFWIKVEAGQQGVSTRLLTVRLGYIENGQDVQIGIVNHIISNSVYADSKLGVFQTSNDAVLQAVLNATILIEEVQNPDNPCGKPQSGNIFSDTCMYQWGEQIFS